VELLGCELKPEVLREAIKIPLDGLVQGTGRDAIDIGEVP
jgi:hypothetical protein